LTKEKPMQKMVVKVEKELRKMAFKEETLNDF